MGRMESSGFDMPSLRYLWNTHLHSVSQTLHFGHLGQGGPCGGPVLSAGACLAASLVSSHQMPGVYPSTTGNQNVSRYCCMSPGGKISPLRTISQEKKM